MLIKEEPQWTGYVDEHFPMFPELEALDNECALPADDFLQALSSGLEIPLLLNGEGSPSHDETPDEIIKGASLDSLSNFDKFGLNINELDDVFANITDADIKMSIDVENELKNEPKNLHFPPSPSPSNSESSGSEWSQQHETIFNPSATSVKLNLDTPPISPPDSESPPVSPQPLPNIPVLQPMKFIPLSPQNNGQVQQHQQTTKFVLAKGNSAKRVCVQTAKTVPVNNNSAEQPKKMIVLSAQDFAALTKNVQQNSTMRPLKIQALKRKQTSDQRQQNTFDTQASDVKPAIKFSQPNQVKIINAIPNAIPVVKSEVIISNAPSVVDTITNDSTACTPIAVNHNKNRSPTAVTTAPILIKTELPEMVNLTARQECELKALKRQQRMIKNRESACLSRKKKKEYVTSLETHISELQEENKILRTENNSLKQRLQEVEARSYSGNKNSQTLNKKNSAILLAVFIVFSINLPIFGDVFSPNKSELNSLTSSHSPPALTNSRHGRSLLWFNAQNDTDEDVAIDSVDDSSPSTDQPMCPMYINRTESIRIDYELRRWIFADPGPENWTESHRDDDSKKTKSLGEFLLPKSLGKLKTKVNKLKAHEILPRPEDESIKSVASTTNNNAVELYSLFGTLRKRDDTFYVVWFSGEHRLFPAVRQNDTARPRMSLVFPAVSVNETFTSPNHVTMMQIDCEVTDTQLVYLQESVIPPHLRTNHKSRSKNPEKSSRTQKSNSKNYKPYFVKNNDTNDYESKSNNQSYSLKKEQQFSNQAPFLLKDKFASKFSDVEDEAKFTHYPKRMESYLKNLKRHYDGNDYKLRNK